MGMEIHSMVDTPVPFSGTVEEANDNHNTHDWLYDEGDTRCLRCDASVRHQAASYPCGVQPPRRMTVVYESSNGTTLMEHPNFAAFGSMATA